MSESDEGCGCCGCVFFAVVFVAAFYACVWIWRNV